MEKRIISNIIDQNDWSGMYRTNLVAKYKKQEMEEVKNRAKQEMEEVKNRAKQAKYRAKQERKEAQREREEADPVGEEEKRKVEEERIAQWDIEDAKKQKRLEVLRAEFDQNMKEDDKFKQTIRDKKHIRRQKRDSEDFVWGGHGEELDKFWRGRTDIQEEFARIIGEIKAAGPRIGVAKLLQIKNEYVFVPEILGESESESESGYIDLASAWKSEAEFLYESESATGSATGRDSGSATGSGR
jgi:hypothetical protein